MPLCTEPNIIASIQNLCKNSNCIKAKVRKKKPPVYKQERLNNKCLPIYALLYHLTKEAMEEAGLISLRTGHRPTLLPNVGNTPVQQKQQFISECPLAPDVSRFSMSYGFVGLMTIGMA